ncbi:MAG TPA: metalloregulator ArsR/SmtB family transcription factor [Tepidisphaeraceae bacterium]|jgi:DNA-binding transcriptional ArsR family regulator
MEAQGDLVDSSRELEPLVELFRLLSDKTRMQILIILAKGERNVGSLCEELRLPQPTVSHHLGLLRSKNLITNRRNGKQVFYALDDQISVDKAGQISIQSQLFNIRIGEPISPNNQLPA